MSIVRIAKYLDEDNILFLDGLDKKTVLKQLCESVADKVDDMEFFLEEIYKREDIMSTGLGLGVAFPHVKLSIVPEFFIAIAICKNGVEWDSFDGNKVNIVFLIGGPYGQQQRYLGILSKLSLIIKNVKNRERLLEAETASDVLEVLRKF